MAQEVKLLQWPSKMHVIPYGRGQLREYWVLALHLASFFHPSKISDHINIILALTANLFSTLLIYLIAAKHTDAVSAALICLVYSTSLWPIQVALYLGHVILAQSLFLGAILVLIEGKTILITSYFAGILCGASFVSSSASRKYLPWFLFIFVGVYSNHLGLMTHWSTDRFNAVLGSLLICVSVWLLSAEVSKSIVRIYQRNIKKIYNKEKVKEKKEFLKGSIRNGILIACFVAVCAGLFVKEGIFLVKLFLLISGIGTVAFHVLMPHILENLNRYLSFLSIGNWANHYQCYAERDNETFGHPIGDLKRFRGGGISWVPKYFWIIAKLPFSFYVICIVLLAIHFYQQSMQLSGLVEFTYIVSLSLVPLLVSEITRAIHVGKAYFPCFLGMVSLIGITVIYYVDYFKTLSIDIEYVWGVMLLFVLANATLTLTQYLGDVLPSRMAPTNLRNFLKINNIRNFATYDNPYNEALVKTMVYTFPNEFEVEYVDRIKNAKGKYFIVPQTSSKAIYMECQKYAIENGDFSFDIELNRLFNSREIQKVSLKSFKTMGSSAYYVHESEVTTYRCIILKQVKAADILRGHAWLLPPDYEIRRLSR